MIKSHIRFPVAFSQAVLSIGFLASFGFFTEAGAACSSQACVDGWGACVNWCTAHNKTNKSQGQCIHQCDVYWGQTATIGRPDPNPTHGPAGPARANPPTTVGQPTPKPRPGKPITQVNPVSVSNPNQTTPGNGPVLLYRQNSSGGGHGKH